MTYRWYSTAIAIERRAAPPSAEAAMRRSKAGSGSTFEPRGGKPGSDASRSWLVSTEVVTDTSPPAGITSALAEETVGTRGGGASSAAPTIAEPCPQRSRGGLTAKRTARIGSVPGS